LLFGHFQFPAWCILRDRFGEELAEWSRCGHVPVNIDDFLTVMHRASLVLSLPNYG
jgi:hypothetical protein